MAEASRDPLELTAFPMPTEGPELLAAVRWAEDRFDRSLLVLGDLTPPLRSLARHFALYDPATSKLRGLSVRFDGFPIPVASIVADDSEAASALLTPLGDVPGVVLVASSRQQLPPALRGQHTAADPWMVGPCAWPGERLLPGRAEPVRDPAEMDELLGEMGMRFWCPAMLRFGHAFGVRGPRGRLLAVAGVNFVLEGAGYAHLGPLVTHPDERGQSLGSDALAAVRASLAASGIARCGLFADGGRPELVGYYERRGFVAAGEFHFFTSWLEAPT